ncbi:methylamine utilization protein [Halopseudomonas nanhaiensis]|uniref:methylamine utilization protein n=1 Tax=Halopseudomonas nanhaiensis TaxID=2830842 RepID=UPI001CBEA525|nr:methylamine utilization protein [Halopseudomonas nanhaiensis]UAW99370.1 methylamine utilization protein [Halopseudomonas nanhaiensis]
MQYRRTFGLALLGASLWATHALGAAQLSVQDMAGVPLADVVLLFDEVPATPHPVAVMDQIDRSFAPRVLSIPPGTLVNFPNSDDVRHHVYSFSTARRFELKLFKGTDAPPVLFDTAGVVVLGCNIHDDMIGHILVNEQGARVSDRDGQVDTAGIEARAQAVSWWHPSLGEGAPRALGSVDLSAPHVTLKLPVTNASGEAGKLLSPLQQRFRKATGHDAH